MPKRLAPDSVKEILQAGRFNELIGAVEDEHLDFKSAPYPLNNDKGKRDLAQDVSEFANAAGGIIVIGVETEKPEAQHADVAKTLHPFEHTHLNEEQYHGVVEGWILPRPEHVTVTWHPPAGGGNEGLASIIIPPQPEALKPFIVWKALVEDTGKTAGAYVGIFERIRAGTSPRSPEEIQQLLHDGRRFEALDARLEALTEQVERLTRIVEGLRLQPPAPPPPPAPAVLPGPGVVEAGNRRGEAVREAGLNEAPTYSLIAVPGQAVEVPELFAGSNSPLVQLLEKPPELRYAGFDLKVGSAARVVGARLRRAVSPGHHLLELWRDGVLIFVAEATDLLCWGTRSEAEPLLLNPLALAETTYLFAELSRRVAQYLQPQAETFQYVLGLQRMEVAAKRAILVAGSRRHRHYALNHEIQRAPGSEVEIRIQMAAELDPAVVAYALRRDLYAWFGFDEDAIPYVAEVGGQRATDPQKIIEDGGGP